MIERAYSAARGGIVGGVVELWRYGWTQLHEDHQLGRCHGPGEQPSVFLVFCFFLFFVYVIIFFCLCLVSLLLLYLSSAANFVDREGYLGTGGPGKADEVLDCVTANIYVFTK